MLKHHYDQHPYLCILIIHPCNNISVYCCHVLPGLFLEAAAVGEMGIVMAARLHSDYNDDLEDPDEMSFLFHISMLPL